MVIRVAGVPDEAHKQPEARRQVRQPDDDLGPSDAVDGLTGRLVAVDGRTPRPEWSDATRRRPA